MMRRAENTPREIPRQEKIAEERDSADPDEREDC
jgi:hypothetical protein